MPLQSYKIKLVSEQFKFTTLYIYIRQIKLKPKPMNSLFLFSFYRNGFCEVKTFCMDTEKSNTIFFAIE